MPSVKIPRKSTATDMTPFVDVAFLILSFFMLATKFKPPAPVQITTPHSVSTAKLKEQNAVMIEFDSSGRVFFTVNVQKSEDNDKKLAVIRKANDERKLGLSEGDMSRWAFGPAATIGSPFASLAQNFKRPLAAQTGIPVDTANNELVYWVGYAAQAFQGAKLNFMVKGDNLAKYPAFKGVIDAFKKNDQFKYQMITDPETVPVGTDLYKMRESGRGQTEE